MSALLPGQFITLGYVQAAAGSLASAQTLAQIAATASFTVPKGVKYALVQAEAQNIRWRDDGTAPTATIGMLLLTGSLEPQGFTANQINNAQFITATAGGILNITLYG